MTCAEFEILLCDYLDGTLEPARAAQVETHQRECPGCAEFARDVTSAVAFIGRVAEVEPPADLLTKITFEIPAGGVRKGPRAWLTGWLQPVLQPRFAMGMAMTILSFSMLGRFAGLDTTRQLKPSDLQPANVWATVEDKAHRTWERAVKYYENLRLVYEVQTRLQEWTTQEEEDRKGRAGEEPGVPGLKQEGKEQK
jgi:hypothetical protein